MATLKQSQNNKTIVSVLLAFATIIISFFAYIREDIYIFSILGSLLYAAPVAFYVLFVIIRIRWVGKFWPCFKFTVFAIVPLIFYGIVSTSTPNDNIEKSFFRVATYNVNLYQIKGINEQLDILEKVDADILSLTEVNAEWERRLKNYSESYPFVYKVSEGTANGTVGMTMLLSKFPITKSVMHDNGYIFENTVNLGNRMLSVVQVHAMPPLGKNIIRKRDETLNKISELPLGEYRLIMGDFNTVHWQQPMQEIMLKQGLRVATKGMPTWPVPLPAAPIDHILTSFNLPSKGFGKVCLTASDHCLIYADIDVGAAKVNQDNSNQ